MNADLYFPEFDGAHVGAMDAGLIGKILLRKPKPLPALSDCASETFLNVLHTRLTCAISYDISTDDIYTDYRLYLFTPVSRKERAMTNGGGQKHGPKKASKRAPKKKATKGASKDWPAKAVQAPAKN